MNYSRWIGICGGSRALAWLTAINVAVWLVVTIISVISTLLASPLSPSPLSIESWLSLPSSFSIFLSRPWTLLTYMVVQYDFLHLLFNVLWLYWFGIILLISFSDRHLLWLYIGGGISGGIFFMASAALGWGGGWLCGSSASVLAVMAATAIRMPNHRLNLFLIGPVALKWVALVCCVLTFIGGGGNQAAHLGGLLFGLTFAFRSPLQPPSGSLRPLPGPPRRGGSSPTRLLSPLRGEPEGGLGARETERLDQLLDKIRVSGYESLSRRERSELQDLSSRIKK